MLNEEYGFDLADMERDFKVEYTDPETSKQKKQKLKIKRLKRKRSYLWQLLFN
jgi:type I restriction enzyme M protein